MHINYTWVESKLGLSVFFIVSQLTLCGLILFDLPVARQVFGFVYLTFVPGIIFIKLLKLNELDALESVLLSMGLSIAYLMIAGLIINELHFVFGFSKPLSLVPLLIVLNGFLFVIVILSRARLQSESFKLWKVKNLISPPVFLGASLLFSSIIGSILVNARGNNVILLLLMIMISLVFIGGVISKKILPAKLYPLMILMISMSILYHSSLISNYIFPFASDGPREYFVFQTTQKDACWNSTAPYSEETGMYNSMSSITILPSIYSNLLNIDPTWVFKGLFPLIFSFVPLGLYQIWKKYVGEKYAYISAFFFVAYNIFYTEMLGLNRQMIAELFFVLLLIVVLNEKMKPYNKLICFMIFSFGLVISHYALSVIFLLLISLTFIFLFVVKKPSRNITASMVALFFVIMFLWYIYTAGSVTFNGISNYAHHVYNQLGGFFEFQSREPEVLRGLGLETPPSIWNAISRAFAYITQFLIVVGFIGVIIKRVKVNLEKDYFTFILIAMAFLAAVILVPELSDTLNMTRFYHILLFVLSPLCAVGAEFLVRQLFERKVELMVSVLLLIVLVPYFFFQTSFIYEITGSDSWSVALSKNRMSPLRLYGHFGYNDDYSVLGAQWLSRNVNMRNSQLYSDLVSKYFILPSYGMTYIGYVNDLYNVTMVPDNGVIYLNTLNVAHGKIVQGYRREYVWNFSELSFIFDGLNKVYSNGGSEVYRSPP